MNKTEIQARVEKCESELASLKADLAKCDCTDGIEQERCWRGIIGQEGYIATLYPGKKRDIEIAATNHRPAYMPECRQVTVEDAKLAKFSSGFTWEDIATELHKLGFRMKVTP